MSSSGLRHSSERREVLRSAPLFTGLDEGLMAHLATLARGVHLPPDGLVYRTGQEANGLYLVATGAVTLYRDRMGQPMKLLARLGAGDHFGEMCLFDEVHRQSSARAGEGTRLLRFDKGPLLEALGLEPQLALRLQLLAARRGNLDAAAALELGRRSEVRIRLAVAARLEEPGKGSRELVLENLSIGGLCLRGAPPAWEVGEIHELVLRVGAERLAVTGRVAWRRGEAVGVAFERRAADHEDRILRILEEVAT